MILNKLQRLTNNDYIYIINLNKNDFGLITRWLKGHCFLARHEAILNNQDPNCNKRFLDEQTPWHCLKEYPATLSIRKEIPQNNGPQVAF
jgi:hypothetical protein